jgi:L-fuculose-phosphate aldolase
MTHDEIKQKLILAGKVLVIQGQDDFTRGHISMRLPDNPSLFFMKPHSVGLDEITMDNILTIDVEGNVVAGTARRHSEVYIHSEIFKARPDVNSVLHTHPTYSIALSATSSRRLHRYDQPDPHACNGCRRGKGARSVYRSAAEEPRRGGGECDHRRSRDPHDYA